MGIASTDAIRSAVLTDQTIDMLALAESDRELLDAVPVLNRLSAENRDEVLSHSTLLTFKTGEFSVVHD